MKNRRKRDTGWDRKSLNMFEDTWTRDTRVLSWAARGLWFEMLLAMNRAEIRGVLPGTTVELALAMGVPKQRATVFMAEIQPMCEELEKLRIWSRGNEVPGSLHPRSIVCRRMYRAWLKYRTRSESGKRGAAVRWDSKSDGKADGKVDGKRDGKQHGKTVAKAMAKSDGNEKVGEPVAAVGVVAKNEASMDGKTGWQKDGSLSLSHSLSNKNRYKKSCIDQGESDHGRRGTRLDTKPVHIEPFAALPRLSRKSATPSKVLAQEIAILTHDRSFTHQAWLTVFQHIVVSPSLMNAYNRLVERLRKDTDPRTATARGQEVIRKAAAFAASELKRIEKTKLPSAEVVHVE